MKEFIFRHPNWIGILVFIVTSIGGSVSGYFLCWLLIETTGSSDRYHGGLMLAFSLFICSIATSIVLGIAFGMYCRNYIKKKRT